MIEVSNLEKLLNKYGIDINKVLEKNNVILQQGNYYDIDKTLNYLVNELKISPRNIEKCSSIMYRDVDNIRENYEFLKKMGVNNINTRLHILSTNPKILKDTYKYVSDNYGISYINRFTSILRVPVSKIEAIEEILSDKSVIISAACSWNTIDDIESIVDVCRKNNIKINGSSYLVSLIINKNVEHLRVVLPYLESLNVSPFVINSASILTLSLEEIIES